MEARPRLRPLDVFPVEHDGRRLFGLRDRLDPSSPVLLLTPEALFLASLMDGERTIPALRAAFMVRTGQTITEGQVTELVEQLEAAHFLDGERYREHLARLREAFARAPVRPAIHAGKAYPGTPEEFRQAMETWSRAANGPRSLAGGRESVPLAGLLAPHIDFHRGGPGYAWACHAMSVASPADLYVVLGTCHAPMALPFASTSKPYDTPFGPTTTAPAFLEHLARRWEADLFADEYAHRGEHSGEFAATWLRYLMAEGAVPETPIVTILCGALHHLVPEGSSPRDVALVEGFVQALGEAIAAWPGKVCLVGSVDLAHVGPQFGDPRPLDRADWMLLERADRAMIEEIVKGDAEGFFRNVMDEGDRRRICGLTPIYVFLRLLEGVRGELLQYFQWPDPNGTVTFATIRFPWPAP